MSITILSNVILTFFLTCGLFFIENERKMKIPNQLIYLWGILSTILNIGIPYLLKLPLSIPAILITGGVGTIINLAVKEKIELQKIYIRSLSVLLLFFLSSLLQYIPIFVFSIDISNTTPEIESYLTLFSNTCLLIGLIFLYWKELKKEFKIFWKHKMENLDTGFKYWFLGVILMIASNTIILLLLPKANAGNEQAVQEIIHASPWISLISTGILAPFIEEITFRKTFRDIIPNNTLFILISGFIFGSLHVVLAINSLYDLAYLVPYCSLGFCFGIIYAKTKTVFTSIAFHMIHNFALTLLSIATTMVILW